MPAGIPAVAQRVLHVTDYLCERALQAGFEVYSSRRDGEKSGIVSLTVPGQDALALVRRCKSAKIIVSPRGGRVRVSPHCYNTPDEMDQLIAMLRA